MFSVFPAQVFVIELVVHFLLMSHLMQAVVLKLSHKSSFRQKKKSKGLTKERNDMKKGKRDVWVTLDFHLFVKNDCVFFSNVELMVQSLITSGKPALWTKAQSITKKVTNLMVEIIPIFLFSIFKMKIIYLNVFMNMNFNGKVHAVIL